MRRTTCRGSFVVEGLESRRLMTTVPAGFVDEPVAAGLTLPTAAEVLPDGRILVAEQGGTLRMVKDGALVATPALSLTVPSAGERGLLGIAADPAFADNHFVYLYYTTSEGTIHNRVSRFTLNGDTIDPASAVTLIDLETLGATNHNGGAIHFGKDGKLYIAVGENATPSNSQTLSNRLGKVLRINSDGSIPTDNPFFGTATGANRAIWALGLRNPFSFAVQPGTGRILVNDVGQNTFEEVDEGIAGANYGWPTTEGPTTNPAFTGPIYSYTHDDGSSAITAGTFYDPATTNFPQTFVGSYFFGDLSGGYIKRLTFGADPSKPTVNPFATNVGSLVDLDVGTDGSLYYLQIGEGELRRIRSTRTAPTVTIKGPAKGTLFDAGKAYAFSATATDSGGAAIAPKTFVWRVEYHDGNATRTVLGPVSGKTAISLVSPPNRTNPDGFYRIVVTATDSDGLATTTSRDFKPHITKVTVKTLPTAGPVVTSSTNTINPLHNVWAVVGSRINLSTRPTQTAGNFTYTFLRWSDGNTNPSRLYTMPAKGSTITAVFRQRPTGIR